MPCGTRFRFFLVLASIAATLCAFGVQAREALPVKTVIVLAGNDAQTARSVAIDQALRAAVEHSDTARVDIFSEFMDAVRFEGPAHASRFATFLRDRYADRKIDVVVATDPLALRFLLQFRDAMFPGVPVVFTNIQRPTLAEVQLPPDFLGVADDIEARMLVSHALQLRPESREIVIVAGTAERDRVWETRLRQAAAELAPTIPHRTLSALPFDGIVAEAARLPPEALIFVLSFRRDATGKAFPGMLPVIDRLRAASAAPIFSLIHAGVGRGALGAVALTADQSAHQAALITKALLNGTPARSVTLPPPIKALPHVDWRELRRFDISESRLSPDTVLLFREKSFWEQYRYHAIGALGLLILQSLLIASLVIQGRRRQRAEREATRQGKELAHLTRVTMLGSLSASIAHELSQPLTAIRLNADIARRMVRQEPVDLEEITNISEDIANDVERASAIIRTLRTMYGKDELPYRPLAIADVVRDTVQLLVGELRNRHTVIKVDVAADCPQVKGDRVQLQQVLVNLVMNACDAMKDNPIADRVVQLRAEPMEDRLCVSVEDSGCGIGPELAAGQFIPFLTTKQHGMGVGLTVCSSIIVAHGGRITAANRAQGGAVFMFDLPVDPDGSAHTAHLAI